MKSNKIFFNSKLLYIFIIFLSLNIFFLSTVESKGKSFDINNIDISRPFEINFNKNEVIDEGFKEAFFRLTKLILSSPDQKKIEFTKINEIKGMIESFSIKEESFINEIYYVKLGGSFNKKKIYNYLEKKNVFPSIPIKKKILFIPVIIDENKKDLLIFSNNKIFKRWNDEIKNFHLIEYILPMEDLEDLRMIKNNYDSIENYNFNEILAVILLVVFAAITNSFILDGKRIGFKAELFKSIGVLVCIQLGYFSSSMNFFVMCYAVFTLLVSSYILFSKDKNIISPV